MGKDSHKLTTTLTREQNDDLLKLCQQNGVKLAWMIRHAVDRLIDDANRGTLPIDFGMDERNA